MRQDRTVLHLREVLHDLQGAIEREALRRWAVLLSRLPGSLRRRPGKQLIKVATHTQRILLQMDADERLAAAAGGAARYLADTAGLDNSEILGLQAAVVEACKYCFHCHSSAKHCDIALQRLTDRIEIDLSFPGKQSPEGKEKPSIAGVDGIECEFLEDSSRMRLTKRVPLTI